jgi:hypothetical protein
MAAAIEAAMKLSDDQKTRLAAAEKKQRRSWPRRSAN